MLKNKSLIPSNLSQLIKGFFPTLNGGDINILRSLVFLSLTKSFGLGQNSNIEFTYTLFVLEDKNLKVSTGVHFLKHS